MSAELPRSGLMQHWSQYRKKKGDHGECDNWREIPLLDVVRKVVTRILQERLQEQLKMCCLSHNVGVGRPEDVLA